MEYIFHGILWKQLTYDWLSGFILFWGAVSDTHRLQTDVNVHPSTLGTHQATFPKLKIYSDARVHELIILLLQLRKISHSNLKLGGLEYLSAMIRKDRFKKKIIHQEGKASRGSFCNSPPMASLRVYLQETMAPMTMICPPGTCPNSIS